MRQTLELIRAFLIVAVTAMFVISQHAQADTSKSQSDINSCRDTVQKFYDWYLKSVQPTAKTSMTEAAMKAKPSLFDPALREKIVADLRASAKNPSEVVGLDFDPFLNAQDDPEKMAVGNATMKGGNCLVEVYRTSHGKRENKKPDVTPELALRNGQWTFVNFHYPPGSVPEDNDLLGVLKKLAADRANGSH